MGTFEYVVLIVFLGLIGYGIYYVSMIIRETVEDVVQKKRKQKVSVAKSFPNTESPVKSDENTKSDAEIIKDLGATLEYSQMAFRTFMLARGGGDVMLLPQVYIQKNDEYSFHDELIVKAVGYDLKLRNLQEYRTGTVWAEREKALKHFEKDLFGKSIEELQNLTGEKLLSAENIADHLIELADPENKRESDYTLRWSWQAVPKSARERELLLSELRNTKVHFKEEES